VIRSLLLALATLAFAGCTTDACEEDPRAQVLDERVELEVGPLVLDAELADAPSERERGWMHRRCDSEALLLVPDTPRTELPVWGCALTAPLDVAFVAEGSIVALAELEPCPEPCGACPRVGASLLVDAVIETPRGDVEPPFELGAAVRW